MKVVLEMGLRDRGRGEERRRIRQGVRMIGAFEECNLAGERVSDGWDAREEAGSTIGSSFLSDDRI